MGAPRYKHQILEYFTERPGTIIHGSELEEAFNLTHSQVVTGVGNLRRQSDALFEAISIIDAGRSWVYHPNKRETAAQEAVRTLAQAQKKIQSNPAVIAAVTPVEPPKKIARPTGKLFEFVGKAEDGSAIVKDERDKLFRVVPL